MYAISLWQPWASLTANVLRVFETRSYQPKRVRIGERIAIHATKTKMGKRWDGKPLSDVFWEEVQKAFGDSRWKEQLPYGKVIAFATLAGAYQLGQQTTDADGVVFAKIAREVPGSEKQDAIRIDPFGDFDAGRWAWRLTELSPAVPHREASGYRGEWPL